MSEEQIKKGRGCFFYGCLTAVVLVVILAVGLVIGVRYAAKKIVDQFTDSRPAVLPKVEASTDEVAALQERVNAFKTALEAGKAIEPLVLAEKELNALIAHHTDFKALKDKVYVSLQGDQIKGQVSIPLEGSPLARVGLANLRGRYLNGEAAFKTSLENGVLIVTLQSLQVKGVPIPEQFLAQMRSENLAKDAYRDPKVAELMRKFEGISVKDGQLTIKARGSQ